MDASTTVGFGHFIAQAGIIAPHDAVHQIGREIKEANFTQSRGKAGIILHAPNLFAAK